MELNRQRKQVWDETINCKAKPLQSKLKTDLRLMADEEDENFSKLDLNEVKSTSLPLNANNYVYTGFPMYSSIAFDLNNGSSLLENLCQKEVVIPLPLYWTTSGTYSLSAGGPLTVQALWTLIFQSPFFTKIYNSGYPIFELMRMDDFQITYLPIPFAQATVLSSPGPFALAYFPTYNVSTTLTLVNQVSVPNRMISSVNEKAILREFTSKLNDSLTIPAANNASYLYTSGWIDTIYIFGFAANLAGTVSLSSVGSNTIPSAQVQVGTFMFNFKISMARMLA